MRILGRSELFVKLAVCTGIVGFVSLGLLELLAQYLQLKLSYTKVDLVSIPRLCPNACVFWLKGDCDWLTSALGSFKGVAGLYLLSQLVNGDRNQVPNPVGAFYSVSSSCWAEQEVGYELTVLLVHLLY